MFKNLYNLFDSRERFRLLILSLTLVLRAIVEMIGVGSIAPFMSVVADPSIIKTNRWLSMAYSTIGFESVTSFLVMTGIAVIVVLAVSNAVSALSIWAMLRFSWGMHHRLSVRLLKGYLSQPYPFFTDRNSAQFNNSILSEVQTVINGVMTPALNVLARLLVVVALVGLIVAIDPFLAAVSVFVLGGVYGLIYMAVRTKQRQLGKDKVRANESRYKITGEAFGGIKDVKVLGREAAFVARFKPHSWRYSQATASNRAIAQLPRYLLETIAFGGIILIVVYYLSNGDGIAKILPTISLYAFAGFRLMPELQNMFSSFATMRFSQAALDDLTADIAEFQLTAAHAERPPEALPFEDEIRLDDVTFKYAGGESLALDSISLRIPKNETVGLVGPSGSGKTTLVDLLLGLYTPDAGTVLVDGRPLAGPSVSAWRRQVGYVPQHIFLCDDSIENNIAFGVPREDIDRAQVEQAARIAHLHSFIGTLPEGYQTVVGERGVRLSGGQRQRIGIARALYHDPQVLVMDEATSALDGVTEDAVMEAVSDLSGQKTLVLIAHRISTVRDCDRIFLLEAGKVAEEGTYDELVQRSAAFRAMAKLQPA